MQRLFAGDRLRSVTGETPRIWLLTTLSLISFVLGAANFGGPIPIAAFLGAWLLVALAHPAYWGNVFAAHKLLWLMPTIAISSVFTSQDPAYSARTAMELIALMGCSVGLAKIAGEKAFISCLAVALLSVAGISFVFGGTEIISGKSGEALHGVFESKNYFAFVLSVGCLANLAVVLDRSQPSALRFIGGFGALACVPLLIAARSVDATAAALGAVVVFGFVAGTGTLPRRHRATFIALGVLLIAASLVLFMLSFGSNLDAILASVGKGSSLTGRAFLWLRARELIAEHPMFGYGYQAFWIHDFTEAEGLWRVGHVIARAGFHFHNLYYETLIELGCVGLAGLIVTVVGGMAATTQWALRNASVRSGFYLSLFVLLLLRSPLEVDVGGPFSIGTLLLTASWVIAGMALRPTDHVGTRSVALPAHRAPSGVDTTPPMLSNEV